MVRKMQVVLIMFLLGAPVVPVLAEGFSPAKELNQFITEEYIIGLPCEQAGQFGPESLPALVEMLKDSGYQDYWENVILTMGCIGDSSAVQPIQDFVENHKGQISFEAFVALQSVPTALGFIAKNGDERALELLSRLARKNYWQQANLIVFDKFTVSSQTIQRNLMRSTILALGNSNSEQAIQLLERMRNDPQFSQEFDKDFEFALQP